MRGLLSLGRKLIFGVKKFTLVQHGANQYFNIFFLYIKGIFLLQKAYKIIIKKNQYYRQNTFYLD